jgi:hypothetical protein
VDALLQPSPDDEISRVETQPLSNLDNDGHPPQSTGLTKIIPRYS